MEQFAAIRRDHRVEGLSIRALADKHRVHRRTVRQALESAVPPPRKTVLRVAPRLEPFKAAIEADVATIMTAHVFMPALDEERPATLSARVVSGLLREELKFEGVILSDDLEMTAITRTYAVPSAAALAIEAGCDGVLICSGDHNVQAAALEALIHAVEEERLRPARVEDALKRQQRAKERFLAAGVAPRPLEGRRIRQVIGRDAHRAIADEMARYL